MQYEIISYEYGSGIYNIIGNPLCESRFRHDTNERTKFTINADQIFEDKPPKGKITYIYENRFTKQPVIDMFFVSDVSLTRFLRDNPLIKKRIGDDYFLNTVLYSHNDVRATA